MKVKDWSSFEITNVTQGLCLGLRGFIIVQKCVFIKQTEGDKY